MIQSIDIIAKTSYVNFKDTFRGTNMITVTDTDFQNNFEKYLQAVQNGNEIIILKNGVEMAERAAKYESID